LEILHVGIAITDESADETVAAMCAENAKGGSGVETS
jgi:hypothetical protein